MEVKEITDINMYGQGKMPLIDSKVKNKNRLQIHSHGLCILLLGRYISFSIVFLVSFAMAGTVLRPKVVLKDHARYSANHCQWELATPRRSMFKITAHPMFSEGCGCVAAPAFVFIYFKGP